MNTIESLYDIINNITNKYTQLANEIVKAKLIKLSNEIQNDDYILAEMIMNFTTKPSKENINKIKDHGYTIEFSIPNLDKDWDSDGLKFSIDLNSIEVKLIKKEIVISI